MIKLNSQSALLLRATEGETCPVLYLGDLDELRKLLDCEYVEFYLLAPGVGVFFPEETDCKFGFKVHHVSGNGIVFRGSGLIVGDDEGNPALLDINFRDLTIISVEYANSTEEED